MSANPSMPLRDLFENLYRPLRMIDASPVSIRHVRIAIKNFEKHLGHPATLADLALMPIAEWMAARLARQQARTTINCQAKLLATLWRFALRKRLVAPDEKPDEIDFLKEKRPLPQAWTLAEMELILKACRETEGMVRGIPAGKFWEALVLIIFDTGIRRKAALAIEFGEIDFKAKTLRVPADRMKNLVEQIFLLSDQTTAAILATVPPRRRLVFPWPYASNKPMERRLKAILKRAGLPHGRRDLLHKLRRTCASHLPRPWGKESPSSSSGIATAALSGGTSIRG
jgi:integrase